MGVLVNSATVTSIPKLRSCSPVISCKTSSQAKPKQTEIPATVVWYLAERIVCEMRVTGRSDQTNAYKERGRERERQMPISENTVQARAKDGDYFAQPP